jgi:hypothetical protein
MTGDGPIFREVDRYVDWWRLDIGDLGFESTQLDYQPLHHYSVGYQPSTT